MKSLFFIALFLSVIVLGPRFYDGCNNPPEYIEPINIDTIDLRVNLDTLELHHFKEIEKKNKEIDSLKKLLKSA